MSDFVRVRTDELVIKGIKNVITGVTNRIYDINGLVLYCEGATANKPNQLPGYAVGATFIDTTTGYRYQNTGTTLLCTFALATTINALTATAAELNLLHLATSANATASLVPVMDANKEIVTAANCGTVATGSTVVEYGSGYSHTSIITVSTTLPSIAGGAALGVGKLLYTLPSGAAIVDDAHMSLAITQTQGHINANTPTVGLGTVIASGVVSVLSGTPTFQNILVGTAAANCTGTATVLTAIPTASVPFVVASGDAHTLYANVACTWAASGDTGALLTGTVVVNWKYMG